MVTRETELREGLVALGFRPEPEGLRQLLELADLLGEEAVPLGLLGPGEGDRLVSRHLLESAALLPYLDPEGPWIDVGSGAGLPGLVLAVLGRARVLLLDAERRRTQFLRRAARRLAVEISVEQGRAEELGRAAEHREVYRAAVARALAPPPVALEYLLPLVQVGGRAVIAAGPGVHESVGPAEAAARELGGAPPRLVAVEVPGLEAERWAMIVTKEAACSERYPRRVGVPARRPLGGG